MNAYSPTGYEISGQEIWMDYIKGNVDKIEESSYGNVYGIINPGKDFKVVIEAHADEISWAVNYVTKEGYIYVKPNGGSDYEIAPGMRALIHLDNGEKVHGVFGWSPVHIKRHGGQDSKIPTIENVVLDCGCESDKEVFDLGIHIGTIVSFEADLISLYNDRYFSCRAFDNRAGGIVIAEVARKIKENKDKLPYSLYVCNCVQEEIGLRGAAMAAHEIMPNIAICTDVTHDTQSPFYNKIKNGDVKCGNGPSVSYSPAIHRNVSDFIRNVAKKHNISIQSEFAAGTTSTDTDSFAYCGKGIPSALISLPLKYMHTTVETVSSNDLDNVIDLMYFTLKEITPDFNTSYFKKK
jgi:putative aminopeptidase FrvX